MKYPICFLFFLLSIQLKAQDTMSLSLPEVIALAQSDAPDALIAETRMNRQYWRYRSVLADFKPFIDLSGDSEINRDIDAITQRGNLNNKCHA